MGGLGHTGFAVQPQLPPPLQPGFTADAGSSGDGVGPVCPGKASMDLASALTRGLGPIRIPQAKPGTAPTQAGGRVVPVVPQGGNAPLRIIHATRINSEPP